MKHNINSSEGRSARPDAVRKASRILEVASHLFFNQGFDAVTMDAVSSAAGVSKATLYAHFKGKEALFTAVVAAETERINREIWPACPMDWGNAADVLRRVATSFFDIFINERTFLMQRSIIGAITHHPSFGRFVLEAGPSALLEGIAEFLKDADANNVLVVPNPKLAAAQFLSLACCDVQTTGFLTLQSPSQIEIDERIDGAIKIFLSYYDRSNK